MLQSIYIIEYTLEYRYIPYVDSRYVDTDRFSVGLSKEEIPIKILIYVLLYTTQTHTHTAIVFENAA